MLRLEVASEAVPEELTVTVPSGVAPSRNVTDPETAWDAEFEIVAVNVTGWLGYDGFGAAAKVVEVRMPVTMTCTAAEVLPV